MQPQTVVSLDDPRVAIYRDARDSQRLREHGCFLVEGRANVRCLVLRSRLRTQSVLVTPTAFEGLRDALSKLDPGVPVYVSDPAVLSGIAGYSVHRGVLAAGEVGAQTGPAQLIAASGQASLVVALEHLANPENVGGIFRNAQAFGADGVLLDPRSCDPLYRKAIRVSMGGTLCLPFARAETWPRDLASFRAAGYAIVGLHPGLPGPGTRDLAELDARWDLGDRVLLILGNEGAGLSSALRARLDLHVRIAMAPEVDSLNVANASAIALHAFARHSGRGLRP